jgi:hypothetical protein
MHAAMCGGRVNKQAAAQADKALEEYKKRWGDAPTIEDAGNG